MTDAEIDALAGAELAAAVCVHVWGWRWWLVPDYSAVALWPPEGADGRVAFSGNAIEIGLSDGGYKRAYGWDFYTGMPRPDRDIAEAWRLFCHICDNSLHSRRRAFMDAIQAQARTADGQVVAWPDVLVVLRDRFPEGIRRG